MDHDPAKFEKLPPPEILEYLLTHPEMTDEELDALPEGPAIPELEGLTGEEVAALYAGQRPLSEVVSEFVRQMGKV